MLFRFLADAIVVLHLVFVLFVVFGGLLVLRWRRIAWVHLPAVAWGAIVELASGVCPLTPLENRLRRMAGSSAYTQGFIEHYVMPVIYPSGLTRASQVALGVGALLFNVVVYIAIVHRQRRS